MRMPIEVGVIAMGVSGTLPEVELVELPPPGFEEAASTDGAGNSEACDPPLIRNEVHGLLPAEFN